jgi:hypothetical protein
VPFAYVEANERRSALVKLRLCADCSRKLNYRKRAREAGASSAAGPSVAAGAAQDGNDDEDAADQHGGLSTKRRRSRTPGPSPALGLAPPAAPGTAGGPVLAADRTNEADELEGFFVDLFQ